MKITIEIKGDLEERAKAAFGPALQEIALKALKRAVGEAELQSFSAAKRQEIEAEARRLNQELELTNG